MDSAEIISKLADLLWVGGLAATPLALLVGGLCRCKGLRPATRHMLWFTVLISFVTPAFGALIWTPHWFRSDRVIAAADAVLPHADLTVDDSRSLNAIPAGPDAPELTVVGRDKIETVVPKSRPAASPSLDSQPAPHRAFAARRPAPLVTADPSPSIGAASIESPVSGQFTADVAPAPATVIEPTPTVWTDAPAFTTKNVEVPADLAATPTGPLASDPTTQPTSPTDAAAPSEAALPSAPASLPFTTQTANQPTSDLRAWLVRLLSVRDALAALPRVPSSLWFAGAFLLLSLTLSRALLARRLIRRSAPASPDVQILVRQVGATLGLTRTPTAVFVDDPVSPMIWCGLRPLLVLPRPLWRTLDEDSRRAVLVHELAHVRRLDHVFCWVQAAIGALYWWHPVVWWARRRIHDEAEASCDAWVTNLFPANRRAYASALIVTKSYLSSAESPTGGPWLGAVSSSAKRLARRITMVMTEKSAPRMSTFGACVATLILTAGAFVMPGLACPPGQEAPTANAPNSITTAGTAIFIERAAVEKARTKNKAKTKAAAAAPAEEPGVIFFGEAPALDAMRAGSSAGGAAASPFGSFADPAQPPEPPQPARAPRAPVPPRTPRPAMAPMAPMAPMTPMDPLAAVKTTAPRAAAGTLWMAPPSEPVEEYTDLEQLKVGRTPRAYVLSAGKLDAFYCLMSRSDVPILVERQADHIVIWGKANEHPVFEQFITILGGKTARSTARTITGFPFDAHGGIAVEGLPLHGQNPINVEGHPLATVKGQQLNALAQERAAADKAASRAAQQQAIAKQYRSSLQDITRTREAFERDAELARAQADKVRESADQYRELAQDLREKASQLAQGQDRKELEQMVNRYRARADAFQNEAKSSESRLARLERQLEELERRAESLEEKLDALNDDEEEVSTDDENEITVEGIEIPEMPEMPQMNDAAPLPALPPLPPASPAPAAAPVPTQPVAPAAAPAAAPTPAPASSAAGVVAAR